jgi:hypothetical protein
MPLQTERWLLDIICIKLNNQPTYSPQKKSESIYYQRATRPTGTPQHTPPVPPGRPNEMPSLPQRPSGTPSL